MVKNMEAILNLQRTALTVVDETTVFISMHVKPTRYNEIILNVYEDGFKPCINPTEIFKLGMDNTQKLEETTRKLERYLKDKKFRRKEKK
jgi:hypothetical protein